MNLSEKDKELIKELYRELELGSRETTSDPIDHDLLNKLNREVLSLFKFSFEITKQGVNFLDNRKVPAKQINRESFKTTEATLRFFGHWILGRLADNNKLFKLSRG